MSAESPHRHFDDAFRGHFGRTYDGRTFEAVAPAYRFGREAASKPDTAGAAFDRVEDTLRAQFELRHPDVDYDDVHEAIRFAYEGTSRLRPAAGDATLDDSTPALQEWNRTLFPGDHDTSTNVTSRNMAQRRPQQPDDESANPE